MPVFLNQTLEQFIQTVKGQKKRFLVSNKLEQLEFKLEENIGIKKHAGKVFFVKNIHSFVDSELVKICNENITDDCEVEFSDCFRQITYDENFAWKCLRLALLSRNEDLVRVLLDHLHVTR